MLTRDEKLLLVSFVASFISICLLAVAGSLINVDQFITNLAEFVMAYMGK